MDTTTGLSCVESVCLQDTYDSRAQDKLAARMQPSIAQIRKTRKSSEGTPGTSGEVTQPAFQLAHAMEHPKTPLRPG